MERMMMQEEDNLAQQVRAHKKLKQLVFGKEGMKKIEEGKAKIEELAKPKDKWKRGRELLELKKKFPHDIVL